MPAAGVSGGADWTGSGAMRNVSKARLRASSGRRRTVFIGFLPLGPHYRRYRAAVIVNVASGAGVVAMEHFLWYFKAFVTPRSSDRLIAIKHTALREVPFHE
jgi:hypothetical protein